MSNASISTDQLDAPVKGPIPPYSRSIERRTGQDCWKVWKTGTLPGKYPRQDTCLSDTIFGMICWNRTIRSRSKSESWARPTCNWVTCKEIRRPASSTSDSSFLMKCSIWEDFMSWTLCQRTGNASLCHEWDTRDTSIRCFREEIFDKMSPISSEGMKTPDVRVAIVGAGSGREGVLNHVSLRRTQYHDSAHLPSQINQPPHWERDRTLVGSLGRPSISCMGALLCAVSDLFGDSREEDPSTKDAESSCD